MQYNILVINWQDIKNPFAGGAEVHLYEIFRRLVIMGHRVTLLCCRYAGSLEEEVIDGIHIIRKGNRNTFNFIVPAVYRELTHKYSFDVVFDDINKIPFFTHFFVKEPIIAIVHHFFGKSIFLETTLPNALYVYLSELLVPYLYPDIPFAVVSESTRRELLKRGVRSDINLLPNAVDLSRYQIIKSMNSKAPVVGYLGRLKKYKSVDHFIRAIPIILKQVPAAQFVIVGDGNDRKRLERLTSRLHLSYKVRFTGTVSQREKVVFLNQMWVAVNPSPKEGWGLTVIEANACQTPVVAANSPGLCDSVISEETGLLFEYGNIEQLAELVCRLLKDERLRITMAQEARKWAETFDWQKSAETAVHLIEESVDRRK